MTLRNLPSAFTDAAQAAALKPVWLVEIATGLVSPNDYLRYCTAERDITFPDGGDVYSKRGLNVGLISHAIERSQEQTLEVADDGTIAALAADWHGKAVTIHRIDRTLTSSATYAQTDVYYVESASPAIGRFVWAIRQLRALMEMTIPRRAVLEREFPGVTERL